MDHETYLDYWSFAYAGGLLWTLNLVIIFGIEHRPPSALVIWGIFLLFIIGAVLIERAFWIRWKARMKEKHGIEIGGGSDA